MENSIATIETITKGQAGRIADRFMEHCYKNPASLPKDAVQQVLEDEGDQLTQEMFEALRKRVEARSGMIVRHAKVNRKQSPVQVIDATGRVKYVNDDVLANMPGEGAEEVDMYQGSDVVASGSVPALKAKRSRLAAPVDYGC